MTPPRLGQDHNFVQSRLPPATNEANPTTMTPPSAANLSAQTPIFHRCNRSPQLTASNEELLPPLTSEICLPPVDTLNMMTANLKKFYVASISSLSVDLSQIMLQPTSPFPLVPLGKILTSTRDCDITFLFHHTGHDCSHLHL